MKFFDSRETAERLPFGALIAAIERVFVNGCNVPRRHIHYIHEQEGTPDTLLIMPAWQNDFLGIKHVTIFPRNSAAGLPGLYSTYTLFDATNGQPLAIMDGDQITCRRTAAASALAANSLARRDATRLLIVGAGKVASVLAPAYAAVRRLEAVMVWDINAEKAESLAAALRAAGFNAARADDLASAVGAADIVTCATLSRAPLVLREWLKPGTHLDLIGSFQPSMRETDDAVFADTSVFIDTTEALEKSGDILSPIENGVFRADQVLATLEDLCRGKHSGRKRDDEITVYKAVGTASEDLAAAMLVYGDRQP